ncbi:MAG: BON domain-containing protein [Pirellulales bacterium]
MRKAGIGLLVAVVVAAMSATASAENARDTAIARRVAQRLKQSGQMHDYRIGVKYKDGTAWLVGTVISEDQIEAALAIAEQTPGVDYVVNKLTMATETIGAEVESGLQQPRSQRPMGAVQQTSSFEGPELPADGSSPSVAHAAALPQSAMPAGALPHGMMPGGRPGLPLPFASTGGAQHASYGAAGPMPGYGAGGPMQAYGAGGPMPAHTPGIGGVSPAGYDNPHMPGYAWPAYAAHPNYAGVTYPRQYSPTAWPYIGPFYPYPQVPLGWRKVTLEWDDGWWMLDFKEK